MRQNCQRFDGSSASSALEGRYRIGRATGLCILSLAVVLIGCGGGARGGRDSTLATWPEWQRIEATHPPSAWQIEEASPAFDAWEASVVVTQLSFSRDATTIRFDSADGDSLEVRLAALPVERFEPSMVEGDTVQVALIRREGFEGVAQGLTVFDRAGRLLFLYDDGGYGAAYYDEGARAGLTVERALRGIGSSDEWQSLEVMFQLGGDSILLAEGRSGRLDDTGLVVTVVVSREWTGPPMTDIDLSPLAYLVFRTDG